MEFLGLCGVHAGFLVKLWVFIEVKAGGNFNWGILGLA
jgi:hypothetical protein